MNTENIYKCVCQVDAQNVNNGGRGTGFFYIKNDVRYFVTNKHVLHDRTVLTLRLRLIEKATQQQYTGVGKIPIINEKLVECRDTDIAAYPVEKLIDDYSQKGYELDYYFINQVDIISEIDKLQWIEDIITIGFPADLTDENTYYPMAFKGITTTPLMRNLEDKPDCLIDCNVSKGSSGSPLFIKENGEYKLVSIIYGTVRRDSCIQNINIGNSYYIDALTCQKESLSIATRFDVLNDIL